MIPVPKLWPGATIVCLASGPSLTTEDVAAVRGLRTIAINTTYRLAPWADVLYAADDSWWQWERAEVARTFAGLKYSVETFPAEQVRKTPQHDHRAAAGVTVLRNTGITGLERDPSGLRTGQNSGYQAVNLAYHLGAKRIILLGYDMQKAKDGRKHWHEPHRADRPSPFFMMQTHFGTLVEPLREARVEIVNCSRVTALTAFPRRVLADVLVEEAAACPAT
jgi:hypothetical protein